MTVLDAFLYKSNGIVSQDRATKALAWEGLSVTDEWNPNDQSQKCKFYAALLNELSNDKYSGVKSISQSGYTIVLDKDEKVATLYRLALESGCSSLIDKYNPDADKDDVVQNASFLW